MGLPDSLHLSTCGERFQSIFAERLQHQQAGLAIGLFLLPDQALVYQDRHCVQDTFLQISMSIADGLSRLKRAPPDKHREPSEESLFVLLQQVITPVNGLTQGLLAQWQILCSPDQQFEPVPQAWEQGLGGEELAAPCCQFDGQGETIHLVANCSNGRSILSSHS